MRDLTFRAHVGLRSRSTGFVYKNASNHGYIYVEK